MLIKLAESTPKRANQSELLTVGEKNFLPPKKPLTQLTPPLQTPSQQPGGERQNGERERVRFRAFRKNAALAQTAKESSVSGTLRAKESSHGRSVRKYECVRAAGKTGTAEAESVSVALAGLSRDPPSGGDERAKESTTQEGTGGAWWW